MTWPMFWITVACAVAILIVFSKIASVRGWAGRVFSRVLPDVSGWAPALGVFFGKSWVKLAAVPVVIGGVLFVVSYIEGRGADKVVAQVERQNTENVERIGRAQTNFERDVRRRMESAAVRELEISEEFADVERTILEADSFEAIAAAHAAGVASLREHAASRHAAVVSDYLSSVSDGSMRAPAGV